MRRSGLYILLVSALTACIENDIPYPVVECSIEEIAAEGLAGEPTIDATARKVTLPLEETTDIEAVEITACKITDEARITDRDGETIGVVGRHDLRAPLDVVLSIYQEYLWTIEAQQTIERRFTVAGQIGSTLWDEGNRTAKACVGFEDLSHVDITGLKLGPRDITRMSCTDVDDFNETNLYLLTDFTSPRRVDVTYHDRMEKWYLTVEYTDIKVSFTRVAPWSHSVWLYADGLNGTKLGFRYREEGAEEWIEVPQEEIVFDGGSFHAQVKGLLPETRYEAVAYSNDDLSTVETFATEAVLPLPNGGFEEWSKPGKVVYPYLSEETAFWDSGNKGSAAVNETICEGSPDIRPGSEGTVSAMLTSKFASLFGIGKFAAGNIFIGTYFNTVGTDGQVNFGRPFASHPIALRGWVKYTQGQIDKIGKVPAGTNLTTDSMDEGSIFIALGTWTPEAYGGTAESPVQVYTKDVSTFFNKDGKDVLGYGELLFTENVGEWRQFTIPIDWRDKATVPTHLIVVCSGSRWGDYFTGSSQSRMWVDDFELIYDDAEL